MKKEQIGIDLKVGIFVTVVLLVLAYMTFTVGDFQLFKAKGSKLYVYFSSVAGVDEKSMVKIAGVDAGRIENIEVVEGKARVTLRLNQGIVIRKDAQASIKGMSMLGEKYLELTVGSPDQPSLKDGDTITQVVDVADLDKLLTQLGSAADDIGSLMKSLNEVLGSEEGKTKMKDTLSNLRDITASINRIVETNDARLNRILANLDDLTSSLKDFSGSLKTKGPDLVDNLKKTSDDIRSLIAENKEAVKNTIQKAGTTMDSVDRVMAKIDKGEGTIGKLVNDDKLYTSLNKVADHMTRVTSFRTFFDFRTEYLTKDSDYKGYFGLTLQPSRDKFYVLQIISDPRGRITTTDYSVETDSGVKTTHEEKVEDKLKFSALIGRRYKDLAVRAGLMENTFGAGGDFFLLDDQGRISLDVWDFNNKETGNQKAHLKISAGYTLFKYIFLNTGYDNFLNKGRRSFFVGGGLRFEDDDLKYLLGSMPIRP